MNPKPETEQPKINGVDVLVVKSLDQLQAACDELVHVRILMPGPKGVRVILAPVRMLRPVETERLEIVLKEAHPPLKEVLQTDGRKEFQYVPTPESLAQSAALQKVARALALWWCCPLFQESEAGKKLSASLDGSELKSAGPGRQAIVDLVQSHFTESILEKMYAVVRAQEFELEERVNFTTPAV